MTSRRSLWVGLGIAAVAVTVLAVWTSVMRFWLHTPTPPPPPSVEATGYAAQTVVAERATVTLRLCAKDGKALAKRVLTTRERLRGLGSVEVTSDDGDADSDEEQCRELVLDSRKVAEVMKARAALTAELDGDSFEADCSGEVAVTAARAAVERAAIEDARVKIDTLLQAAHASAGATQSASVSSEEGSWDERCERTVTGSANISLTPR